MIKDDKCPLCEIKVETITHLFIECKVVSPLNRMLLKLLNSFSDHRFKLTEPIFRFCSIPYLEKYQFQLGLILFTESRHLIWMNRNLSKYENKKISDYVMVAIFFSKLKRRIIIDHKRLNQIEFIKLWCINGFCVLDVMENTVEFHDNLDINTYFQMI